MLDHWLKDDAFLPLPLLDASKKLLRSSALALDGVNKPIIASASQLYQAFLLRWHAAALLSRRFALQE